MDVCPNDVKRTVFARLCCIFLAACNFVYFILAFANQTLRVFSRAMKRVVSFVILTKILQHRFGIHAIGAGKRAILRAGLARSI